MVDSLCRTVTLEGSLLTTTKIPSFEAVWTFYAHFLLLAINGQRCPFHPRCLLIVYPRADAGRSVGICCQPRRLLRLSPPRRPPSWRELASNVHAKFASYLSRDPATRLQGGADGVRQRAQTSVSPPWPATRTPGPGTARGCPGDGCVAVATHPPQGWTRRVRG